MNESTMLHTITEKEAAAFLGWSTKTLQNRRWKGLPPQFLRLGRSIRYRVVDLQSYLDSCTVEPFRKG